MWPFSKYCTFLSLGSSSLKPLSSGPISITIHKTLGISQPRSSLDTSMVSSNCIRSWPWTRYGLISSRPRELLLTSLNRRPGTVVSLCSHNSGDSLIRDSSHEVQNRMDSFKHLNSVVGLPNKSVQTLARTTAARWATIGQLSNWVGRILTQ